MSTPVPTLAILRTNLSTDDDNFFITRSASKSNYVYFDLSSVTGGRKITMPNNDVTLGTTSVAANDVTSGETNASSFRTTTGSCTVGDDSGTLVFNGSGAVDLETSGAITIDSSASTIGIGTDNVDQNINVGTGGSRTITIGNDTDSSLDVNLGSGEFTVDGSSIGLTTSGASVGDITLTSGTNSKTAIDLTTSTGGISLTSATTGTGAFGTNVDGTRFFKVETSANSTTGTTFTFTGTETNAPYLVEVRTSIRDTTLTASGFGSIIAKACFNKVGTTVTPVGDSFETFGTPTAEIAFGTGASTFTVTFKLTSGTNATSFDGSIMIHTEDTGVYRSS